jgi:hypothetical protein
MTPALDTVTPTPEPDDAAPPASEPMGPQAFFHDESGAVRFWVRTAEGSWVGAIARKQVLRFRFGAMDSGEDALKVYQDHRHEIDAAVLRRVAAGSIEPVILREADFKPA